MSYLALNKYVFLTVFNKWMLRENVPHAVRILRPIRGWANLIKFEDVDWFFKGESGSNFNLISAVSDCTVLEGECCNTYSTLQYVLINHFCSQLYPACWLPDSKHHACPRGKLCSYSTQLSRGTTAAHTHPLTDPRNKWRGGGRRRKTWGGGCGAKGII